MLILDTDLLTIIQKKQGEVYDRLNERLQQVYDIETVAVTVVSLEEQMRGWLAYLKKKTAKDSYALIDAYQRFHTLFVDHQNRTVLDFDEEAWRHYEKLKGNKIRVGAMDLRIASIALAHDATLLTRNIRDFVKIPGLKMEDWTVNS